jgi:hypothetical protein
MIVNWASFVVARRELEYCSSVGKSALSFFVRIGKNGRWVVDCVLRDMLILVTKCQWGYSTILYGEMVMVWLI